VQNQSDYCGGNSLEHVNHVPLHGSEAVDASRLVRLLRRILTENDTAFLLEENLPGSEMSKWRDARKAIYFETLRDLSATITFTINEYSMAHFSRGSEWGHIENTFRLQVLSSIYLVEMRMVGYAYFLGFTQAIPAAEKILQNLTAFVQPLQMSSDSILTD
jgi:hypothetical protein